MQSGDHERIRQKAYELWEKEGRPEGKHDDHWHRARQESGSAGDPAPKSSNLTLPPDPDTSDVADADVPALKVSAQAAGDKPARKSKAEGKAAAAKKPAKKKS